MARIRFQNGAEASSDLLLDEEIADGTSASDTKKRLAELVHLYGTVDDAVAWLDGTEKPKKLEAEEAPIPPTSRLLEQPPQAPPSPEVEAKEIKRFEKAEAENQEARDEAVAAHAEAQAKAAAEAEKAEAKAESAKK